MEQFDIQSLAGGQVDMSKPETEIITLPPESQEVALLFAAY